MYNSVQFQKILILFKSFQPPVYVISVYDFVYLYVYRLINKLLHVFPLLSHK